MPRGHRGQRELGALLLFLRTRGRTGPTSANTAWRKVGKVESRAPSNVPDFKTAAKLLQKKKNYIEPQHKNRPRWLSGQESACQCRRHRFDPWLGKMPWGRKWQPALAFSPGKSSGQSEHCQFSWQQSMRPQKSQTWLVTHTQHGSGAQNTESRNVNGAQQPEATEKPGGLCAFLRNPAHPTRLSQAPSAAASLPDDVKGESGSWWRRLELASPGCCQSGWVRNKVMLWSCP